MMGLERNDESAFPLGIIPLDLGYSQHIRLKATA